jgi:RNA polymerase sigma-B factor
VSDAAAAEAVTAGIAPLEADRAAPEMEPDRCEERVALEACLGRLDHRERVVVFLRFFEDLTQQETAERVGVSQMHVSRLLRSALETMRDRLDAEGG